jgi:hypothetical protein
VTKAKPQSKFKNKLNEVIALARCMVGSLEDTKRVASDDFSDDLIRQLNQSIYHAEALLAPLKNPRAGLVAEIFYQLGILVGAAEAQIFSAYTLGVTKRKKSQGGKIGGQQGIYQKYESILLIHFCRLNLKNYRSHAIARQAFNTETKISMPPTTWSRLYNKFRRGEKLWQNSELHLSPKKASKYLLNTKS